MKMKKVTSLLAMTVAAVMAMTGCGGNDAAEDFQKALTNLREMTAQGIRYITSALFSRWSMVLWIRQQRALRIS